MPQSGPVRLDLSKRVNRDDGFEIVVKDSHGDRGHFQQAISVS
jgi:hypothetical protein